MVDFIESGICSFNFLKGKVEVLEAKIASSFSRLESSHIEDVLLQFVQ